MDYGMIGKIQKSKRYAEERYRFQFKSFELTFDGDNNPHEVSFDHGVFQCDCEFFITHHARSAQRYDPYRMALEILLKDMIPIIAEA
jgi:hypothetical protein